MSRIVLCLPWTFCFRYTGFPFSSPLILRDFSNIFCFISFYKFLYFPVTSYFIIWKIYLFFMFSLISSEPVPYSASVDCYLLHLLISLYSYFPRVPIYYIFHCFPRFVILPVPNIAAAYIKLFVSAITVFSFSNSSVIPFIAS